MLVCIPGILDREALAAVRSRLEAAGDAWVDGRVTAGHQGAPVKFNQQIDEGSQVAFECQSIVASALERHPTFISAALPNLLYPPMFNRYGEGMRFGLHVDGARAISLVTWSSWVLANLTGVMYGAWVVRDGLFVAISAINLVCCATVALIAARRRGLL